MIAAIELRLLRIVVLSELLFVLVATSGWGQEVFG